MWYLWCGSGSPLFGRDRITTFEHYFVSDRSTWTENKNAYYRQVAEPEACGRILKEFGLDPEIAHIVNGHVPVKAKKGESPVRGGGRLLVIDGGFCKAYHETTGIAGYTLIYSSQGLKLVSHEAFAGRQAAVEENTDILSTTALFEPSRSRLLVRDTDVGRDLQTSIASLTDLLTAYRQGWITPR